MRTSLGLAVGGALILMAGVALVLVGLALRAEHPRRPPALTGSGLVLVILGLAIGAAAAAAILLDPAVHLPSGPPSRRVRGPAPDELADFDPAEYGPATYNPGPVPPAREPGDREPGPASELRPRRPERLG
jgi:hypothetical protein